jgi:GNAT superfamily N-acetyltransferase
MVELKRTSSEDPNFYLLIRLLDEDLWKRYPYTQQKFVEYNIIKLNAKVVIAYDNEEPVGCGCFRKTDSDGTVEIKRMYVLERMRGKGIAKLMLCELEQWAAVLGMKVAILETGINQPEAIALYVKAGYRRIENYGPYKKIDESICMSKGLSIG